MGKSVRLVHKQKSTLFLYLKVPFQINNKRIMALLRSFNPLTTSYRCFHQSQPASQVMLLSRLRVVDNSSIGKEAILEGRPPKVIQVYNKTGVGHLDKVLVAIKGQKKKSVLVGLKQKQKAFFP